MVDKQTLELCTFEEGSQMDNMLVQTNKPYKCNLCDKTFSTPSPKWLNIHAKTRTQTCSPWEGRSILLGSGDSEVTERDHPVLASIKGTGNSVVRLNVTYLFKNCHFYKDSLRSLPQFRTLVLHGMIQKGPAPFPLLPCPQPLLLKVLCIINLEHISLIQGILER